MVTVYILSHSRHLKPQQDKKFSFYWKWGRCSLNCKTIFLRLDLPERVDNFFSLIVCCSFPTVSRWPLAFTYQQIFLCLLLISTQNLSINENDLLKYSSKSKPPYFISIFFKLQSYFFSNSLNVLTPTEILFLATKYLGSSWDDLFISRKAIGQMSKMVF